MATDNGLYQAEMILTLTVGCLHTAKFKCSFVDRDHTCPYSDLGIWRFLLLLQWFVPDASTPAGITEECQDFFLIH